MTSNEVEVAVVLGPAAMVGTAWTAGLAEGLRLEESQRMARTLAAS